MRIRSAVAAVATLALTAGVMSSAAADPGDPATPPAAPAEDATGADGTDDADTEVAEQALADAQLLFDADPATMPAGDRDATMVLRDLVMNRSKLSGTERARANRLLARPRAQQRSCGPQVCVHWSNRGPNKVNQRDRRPRNGTPDYVDKVLRAMGKVHRTYVRAGYRAPLKDAGQGGNKKRDVYLLNIGSRGLYGYCTSDRRGKRVPAYCALDNNFSKREFPTNTPLENMRVTAAHEYFHAVQFAYDYNEDLWFMEATATWAEDELFDGVNDNVNYLPSGQLGQPALPLDSGQGLDVYGNWIFFRYLTERMTASKAGMPVLVRDMWRSAGRRLYGLQAVRRELADRGRSLPDTYGLFTAANRRPRTTYVEGQALRYPVAPPRDSFTLTSGESRTSTRNVDHLSSTTVRFTRGPGVNPSADLRLDIDMASTAQGSRLVLTHYRTNGTIDVQRVGLDSAGDRTDLRVPFGSGVRRVEATLVNASSRLGTSYNNRRANITGTVVP